MVNISKSRTVEEYKNELKIKNPNIVLLDNYYINSQTPLLHKCLVCNFQWKALPNNLIRGHGCKNCRNINTQKRFSKSPNDFINDFKFKNSHANDIELLSEYVGAKIPLKCKCKTCNYIWNPLPDNLLSKNTGCPRCNNHIINYDKVKNDLLNKCYNIEFTSDIYNSNNINCKCKICGHKWVGYTYSLLKGHSCRKCADLQTSIRMSKTHEQYVSELAKINPSIEVLDDYELSNIKLRHRCKICGNIWDAFPGNIINKNSGCPICASSFGEQEISNILDNYKINYITQYSYDDLIGLGGGLLRYDFYLPQYNYLIEFNGEQHEHPIDFFGGEEGFIRLKKHDELKEQYAIKNNIPLYKIWYDEFDDIEDILINILKLESVTTAG